MYDYCGTINGEVGHKLFDTLDEAIAFGRANSEGFDVIEWATQSQVYCEYPKTVWV